MAFELQSKVCTFFFMLHVFWLQKLDEELKNGYIFINISYIELVSHLNHFIYADIFGHGCTGGCSRGHAG